MQNNRKKQSAYRFGLWAEYLVMAYLVLKGYTILFRRFRTPCGEIDIIAKRGNTVAMIEVKARKNRQDAYYALSSHQQQRIRNGATTFLARYKHFNSATVRFDMMLVTPWQWPLHMENAW